MSPGRSPNRGKRNPLTTEKSKTGRFLREDVPFCPEKIALFSKAVENQKVTPNNPKPANIGTYDKKICLEFIM